MLVLLSYIPPVHHNYFKNLPVPLNTRASGASMHIEDEENDQFVYGKNILRQALPDSTNEEVISQCCIEIEYVCLVVLLEQANVK